MSDKNEIIRSAAAQVAENYRKSDILMYGDALRLPSRTAVIEIIRDFQKILFPAYYGDRDLLKLPPEQYSALLMGHVYDKLVGALDRQKYDFICLNFANGDMVGHTGVYEAIEKAVKAVDACVAKVVEAALRNGYEVVQIADHGNADNAVNADGTPNTAHSLNPVPIVVVSDRVKTVRDGILADVAPTVLDLMGLEKPEAMTGHSLVEFK